MSVEQVVEDVVTGDFSDAEKKISQWWSGLIPEIQSVFQILASAEGQILQGLVITAAKDVISGGLTTVSFVSAAKDVEAQLVAQNIKLGTQTIFTALNAVISANQTIPVGL